MTRCAAPSAAPPQAGYTTVGAGKVYHKSLPPNWDMNYSWDPRMADGTWDEWMYPGEDICENGTAWCAVPAFDENGTAAVFEDGQTSDVAIAQLRNLSAIRAETGAPWFVAAGYRKPHLQWRFPEEILELYPADLGDIPLPAQPILPAGAPDVSFHMAVDDFLQAFSDVQACGAANLTRYWSFPDDCVRAWRRAYWASVSYMDSELGRVVAEVDALGETDNTIMILFGDHGWHVGEYGEWEKFTNFEYATRTPLIFKVPPFLPPLP
jgi:iduronate 2-sulfatase